MPKIGDGFSQKKEQVLKRKKVKIRKESFSRGPQSPITRFFKKESKEPNIIDSPGKRKKTPENEKIEKKQRLGDDYSNRTEH